MKDLAEKAQGLLAAPSREVERALGLESCPGTNWSCYQHVTLRPRCVSWRMGIIAVVILRVREKWFTGVCAGRGRDAEHSCLPGCVVVTPQCNSVGYSPTGTALKANKKPPWK